MKRFLSILSAGLLAGLLANTACREEDGLNLGLTPPDSLRVPANDAFVKLEPTTTASVVFEWKPGRAADGALLLYEVAFDREAGDFSNPVFKVAADGNGGQNKATLSHKDLNAVAGLAGIGSLSRGRLKWTVLAAKGTNVQQAAQARLIELERPAGIAQIPADVYLTGDATEYGTDLSKAARLRQTNAGEFEIYTSLKEGTYRFVDGTTGTPVSFSLVGDAIRETGTTAATGAAKAYRIRLDFNNAAAQLTEIKEMGLWFSPRKQVIVTLPYVGNGTWKVENTPIEFFQESWGRDERYKFRATVQTGSGPEEVEFFGSTKADNQRPNTGTPPEFYYLVPVDNSDYDFTYKFRSEADRANADITVLLGPDVPNYTHQVTIR